LKFAVFTDLHYDVIHDAGRRLQEFINVTKDEKCEFIIALGDLCNPIEDNRHIINCLREFIPCYFNIGNHDSDRYSMDTILNFFHLEHSYYSFIINNIKFIMLNANFIRTANGCTPFKRNEYYETTVDYPYIPPEEVEWLKKELEDDHLYYIVLSHHSLTNDFMRRGISNRTDIRDIFERRNKGGKKVLFCMNGHDHGDDIKEINGIHYYTLNSISYIWHGLKKTHSYSKEIHEKYPYMKEMLLYEDPLHVIVTIDDDMHINIKGMEGNYQNLTPKEIALGNRLNAVSIEPRTSSLTIAL
jgi:3',5'-cyclic AMP phosphodiesterase CpdA